LGVLLLLIVEFAAVLALSRSRGVSAREAPTAIEGWIALGARNLAIPADAKRLSNPVAATPETLAEARAHWADHGWHPAHGLDTFRVSVAADVMKRKVWPRTLTILNY
jgi:hypothetical protein